jgi:hypothetical protein
MKLCKNTDNLLRHKASLSKFKKVDIISYILSDHNEIKLEMNTERNYPKETDTCC